MSIPRLLLSRQNLPLKRQDIPLFSGQTILAIPNNPQTTTFDLRKGETIMSSKNNNKLNVPEARAAMDKFKMEAAADLRVPPPS